LREGDPRRHFVGEVVTIEHTFAHLRGYAFVYDGRRDVFARQGDLRDRIFDLADPCCHVNVLSPNFDLESLQLALGRQAAPVTTQPQPP